MFSIKTKHPGQSSPSASGVSQSAWASRLPQETQVSGQAPSGGAISAAQFKVRLDSLIRDARSVLDDVYARQWGQYRHPEKIVERLDALLKRSILMRSLLELHMTASDLHRLQQEEIDFVRGAELFLEQLGAQQLREADDSRRAELI